MTSVQEMVSASGLSGEQTARVLRVLEGYLAALEGGAPPHRDELLARHPDLADLLGEYLDRLDQLHEAAAGLRASPPAEGVAAAPLGEHGRLGDFDILREVGRGGMGIVYEAEQISLGRRVALKVLPFAATMDPRQLQRFHNEARAAASLHHEHIVPVHAVGCERNVHYYAMQFIEGQSLAEVIAALRDGPPSAAAGRPTAAATAVETAPVAAQATSAAPRDAAYYRRVAEWGIQAAEALEHAHATGVVHRDVKPGNLLIDAQGKLWVTDFGLARCGADGGLTMTGDLVGTLRYMSPEQALAKHGLMDHRTDIYSLGATLYELLALRPAIDGEDREEILRNISFEEPRSLRQIDRRTPADLETVIGKALAKEPAERYATAQGLADDLRRWLEDKPIRARRPTLWQRALKWARRHRALVGSAAAMLVLAAIMLAGNIGWTAHDWTSRYRETERVVVEALKEADEWQEKGRLPEALSAARRADGLAQGGTADEALRRRAQSRLADLELLGRLEDARLEGSAVKDGHFDYERVEARYQESFRGADIDVEALSVEEAGRRIRRTTVVNELAARLDHWAMIRRFCKGRDDMSWKHFLAVARAADPDRSRARVREVLERRERPELLELATSEEAFGLLPATMEALAQALEDAGAAEQAVGLLREVQRRYPGDFWTNQILANVLYEATPRVEEAIIYHTAAVALRPYSPGAHLNLARDLHSKQDVAGAIAEYRTAIALDPKFVPAHYNLGNTLRAKGDVAGAIAEYRTAIALDPKFAPAHYNLGNALRANGDVDGAIDEYRRAIELDPKFTSAHFNLGSALRDKGNLDGAIAAYRKAIDSDLKHARAHNNLGVVLHDKGDVDGAIAEWRQAIALDPKFAPAHNNLGNALHNKKDLGGAIAAYRKAIDLDRKDASAHSNLSNALRDKGDLDGAIAESCKAIELDPKFVDAHSNLGNALRDKGDLDGAIAEHSKAIELKPDHPGAHFNLGLCLRDQGHFAEALTHLRRGHELGSKNPRWPDPSAQLVKGCERLVELDRRLPAILKGEAKPADVADRLELAFICCTPARQLYGAAVLFYADALAADPRLTASQPSETRYNAACAAALAGCGEGKDANHSDDKKRARLRHQALEWLRADLTTYRRLLETEREKAGPLVRDRMQHWQQDKDFAGVRGDALTRLPEAERPAWKELWADVAVTLARAEGKAAPEKKPATK